jgi:hypothetical protein
VSRSCESALRRERHPDRARGSDLSAHASIQPILAQSGALGTLAIMITSCMLGLLHAQQVISVGMVVPMVRPLYGLVLPPTAVSMLRGLWYSAR